MGRAARRNISAEVEPLKDLGAIKRIKQYLYGKESRRDYLLFVMGINVGLRIGDLLQLRIEDVVDENTSKIKSSVQVREQKTGKMREFTINKAATAAIQEYLDSLGSRNPKAFLFKSRKGDGPLTTRSAHKLIKTTLRELGIKGNYGTHSLRKTFGYHRYINNVKLETLQRMFNHSSPATTLRYIGITREVIIDAYNSVNL